MKTSKRLAAEKRLNALTVKSETNTYPLSKSSNAYKLAVSAVNGEKVLRPCHTSGRGRFTSNIDCTDQLAVVLGKIGFEFEKGNDSPRGGLTGNFIKVTTKIYE